MSGKLSEMLDLYFRELWHGNRLVSVDEASEAKGFVREVAQLEAQVEALRERNEQHTYCAYCGQEFPIDDEHTTLKVGIHIWECEKHPLHILCENIEERCKDLDHEAQEHLASDNVQHASGIHKAIDYIRQEVERGKQSSQRMKAALLESESEG